MPSLVFLCYDVVVVVLSTEMVIIRSTTTSAMKSEGYWVK